MFRAYYWTQICAAEMRRAADRELRKSSSISAVQLGALFYIRENAPCLLSELARGLRVNGSAVTTLAGRLERDGLIERRRSEEDKRAFQLTVTERGDDAIKDARPVLNRLNSALQRDFSKEELETVERFLKTTTRYLESVS